MKGIHKPACSTANDAAPQAWIMNRYGFVCLFAAFFNGNRRLRCRRRDDVGRCGGRGTLIHNGNCNPSLAISPLSVSLIKFCFESFSVTEVRCTPLFSARFLTALITAVLMAPIASTADAKQRPALAPSANSLAQNIFSGVSHSHPKVRLDNGRQSCQLSCGCIKSFFSKEVLPSGLGRWNRSRPLLLNLPNEITRTQLRSSRLRRG